MEIGKFSAAHVGFTRVIVDMAYWCSVGTHSCYSLCVLSSRGRLNYESASPDYMLLLKNRSIIKIRDLLVCLLSRLVPASCLKHSALLCSTHPWLDNHRQQPPPTSFLVKATAGSGLVHGWLALQAR